MGRAIDILSLTRCLQELEEVKEFVPRGIDPDMMFFTAAFAAHLSTFWGDQGIRYRRVLMDGLYFDQGQAFLEIWEEHVYPVLKAVDNESWAEMWRGGHITNDAV